MKKNVSFKAHFREILLIILDMAIVAAIYSCCFFVSRVYLSPDVPSPLTAYLLNLALLIPIYLIVLIAFGVYRSLWSFAQSREYFLCTIASLSAGMLFFAISRALLRSQPLPFYFYLLIMCMIAITIVAVRLAYRILRDRLKRSAAGGTDGVQKVVIIGCGDACQLLVNEMNSHPECGMTPVAAVDNDISKVGRSICGVPIEGTDSDVSEVCKRHNADLIIIAIPSANNKQRAALLDKCSTSGCKVKMLPRLTDFHSERSTCIQKLRDITPEELLGREPIVIENNKLETFINGKCVMVTGGGGSIGSELCRQIASYSPRKLVIVDIYENNAYDIEQELRRRYNLTHDSEGNDQPAFELEVYIASVRDYDRMLALMDRTRPELVIHAAAHKHVPLMEDSPTEAIKNNVLGTLNTARAAIETKVSRFVLISTDKAVNPTSFMGASKRVCEMIIEAMDASENCFTRFSAVRFGNVLGSNGSVIPLFKKQIEEGGPVTVTHEDIIRYFMTIPEAVQLVLASASMAKGGEIFVLDMGEQVRILDLAKKMIALSGLEPGKDIDIKITGLRPGEKLYEELWTDQEVLDKTDNGKISVAHPDTVDRKTLLAKLDELGRIAFDTSLSADEVSAQLEEKLCGLIPNFVHKKLNN